MSEDFQLLIFSTDPDVIRRTVAAGVAGVIVDWETVGKEERQGEADTEINCDSVADLERVRAATDALVVCRINPYAASTSVEIERAIDAGANEILLPMVRRVDEVERVLEHARDRIRVGILIETRDGVTNAAALARQPLARVYVGLNDLAIERQSMSIFEAVRDGTVERLRGIFDVPFGFAGLTLPYGGSPIPCRLLMAEMARLQSHFTFLRRSFFRDTRGQDPAIAIPIIQGAVRESRRRSDQESQRDHRALERAIADSTHRAQQIYQVST